MLVFFTPRPCAWTFGEKSIDLTAGRGSAGDGDVDRRMEGDELNELRRLAVSIGGFIGSENDVGVPGVDGAGDAMMAEEFGGKSLLLIAKSGGAGLFEETRLLGGRSIFAILPCWERENCPSFDLRV